MYPDLNSATQTPPKHTIKQRLRTDYGLLAGVTTAILVYRPIRMGPQSILVLYKVRL